jgi:pimeloyl-ACP methyl ester carboxylesterase
MLVAMARRLTMSTRIDVAPRPVTLPSAGQIVRSLGSLLLRLIGFGVAALLALPVLLLPFFTPVPAPVWVPLALAELALMVMPFWLGQPALTVPAAVLGLVTVGLIAVAASQVYASTPRIVDEQGRVVPGSIASLEQVTLGGSKQWITIRGRDGSQPVLLFLAGGPGGSELPFMRNVLGGLEDHFVVVNWDQPGAAKSYGAVRPSELTIERYVSDAHELTQLLRARFHQDKIYVLGESWGTVLGTLLVQRYPGLFHAYIGAGQRTSVHEDDVMGYEFALQVARERGDAPPLEKLERNGPPPYTGWNMAFKNLDYLNVLNRYAREHASGEPTGHDLFSDMFTGTEYGLADKVNWVLGLLRGFSVVYPQLDPIDFAQQATELEVPVYFLQGRYDLVEMGSLLERWVAVLDAPHKEIIYFENSGHTPHSWEPNRVVDVVVNRVLPETFPQSH